VSLQGHWESRNKYDSQIGKHWFAFLPKSHCLCCEFLPYVRVFFLNLYLFLFVGCSLRRAGCARKTTSSSVHLEISSLQPFFHPFPSKPTWIQLICFPTMLLNVFHPRKPTLGNLFFKFPRWHILLYTIYSSRRGNTECSSSILPDMTMRIVHIDDQIYKQ